MVKNIIIAIICLIITILLWVSIFDTNRFTVSRYEYTDNRIKKRLKAIVLSDLHNTTYGAENEKLLEAIDEENPDIILIAGDMINGHPKEKSEVAINLLDKLSKKYPIYYANGNHEMRMSIYLEDYGDKYEKYCDRLSELGITHLVNERVFLEEYGIEIIGSEIAKEHYKRIGITPMKENELLDDLGEVDEDKYSILIAHNPDFFKDYASYGADLVLSGHIHGGIVRIPFVNKGVLSPNVSLFPKYDAGEYTKDKTTMIVSRGLGIHTIPIRMFNPGDLVVIEFIPDEDN